MKMKKYLFLMAGLLPQTQALTPFDHAIYDLQLLNCKKLNKTFLFLTSLYQNLN